MKHVQLVIAKIRPEIYQLIEEGKKTWEVRDDSFTTEDDTLDPSPIVIQYVDLHGKALGLWQADPDGRADFCKVGKDGKLNSGAKRMLAYSSVGETTFRHLFNLEHTLVLHGVRLMRKLNSPADITDEEES